MGLQSLRGLYQFGNTWNASMEIITQERSTEKPLKPVNIKAENQPLGIYTNNATPKPVNLDKEIALNPIGSNDVLVSSATRFLMQSGASFLLPKQRVNSCLKIPLLQHGVEIWSNKTEKRSRYGNMARCGSIWNCPCCASKVSEQRKIEIEHLVNEAEKAGYQVQMITLTAPHQRTDDYSLLVSKIKSSMRELTKPKSWKSFLTSFGIIGSVRAFECTHSDANGYHPHFHLLVIFEKPLTVSQQRSIKKPLHDHWTRATTKSGLGKPSYRRGVDIRTHNALEKYLTKTGWSLSAEMTKSHIKKGKSGSRSPFQLLHDYVIKNDKRAGMLFKTFAESMKGYRQLTWSRGLKKKFNVTDLTDEEIAESSKDEGYSLLGLIPFRIFKKCWGSRGSLLQIAKTGELGRLQKFISMLTHIPIDQLRLEMRTEMKLYKEEKIIKKVFN